MYKRQLLDFAREHDIPIAKGKENDAPYSVDANLLHSSSEGKVLEDPTRIPDAVEETLRYWAPSQYQGRVLTDDVTMRGVTMPKGSRVLMLTGAANHDERQYPDPDRFDIDRPAHLSLGLGHGIHFCLGASLARMEGRVGIFIGPSNGNDC